MSQRLSFFLVLFGAETLSSANVFAFCSFLVFLISHVLRWAFRTLRGPGAQQTGTHSMLARRTILAARFSIF